MKRAQCAMVALAIACGMGNSFAWAQRGAGDPTGVAQQVAKPKVVSLAGTVLEVKAGPCEGTTGRSPLGTHFFMKTKKGETLNIHLGPAGQVDFVAAELSVGQQVKVEGFRTDEMQKDHYVARTVAFGDRTISLRDENLRPVWAGGAGRNATVGGWADGGARRGQGDGNRRGRGQGAGYGRQGGRGAGWGQNSRGQGRGQ